MDIINFIEDNQSYITIGISILLLVVLIISIISLKKISKLKDKYNKIMRGTDGKNIEEVVVKYFDKIDDVRNETNETSKKNAELEKRIRNCIQKISIIRYKAFENVGGDLSFSIALLDDNNDGFILTGIYGRNDSTTYAKPIENGKSKYELSEEEKEVLNKAINSK